LVVNVMSLEIDIDKGRRRVPHLPLVIVPDAEYDVPVGGVYAPGLNGEVVRPIIPARRRPEVLSRRSGAPTRS
jgi:hypothetical protein